MKHLSRITLAVILVGSSLWLLASGAPGPALQDPEVQFQRAVQLETIEGNLNAAIDLYKQVIHTNGNNRALAAKALLRLGGCYEKQGKAEALKAYEQLLRDYADQADSAAEARTRLAALQKPAGSESEPITRRVWAGPKTDFFGAVSPDGKYLSFVDWDTGDLAVRDLENGINRRITNKGSWEENEVDEAELSIWSPDSRQIAYQWSTIHGYELRVIGLDHPTPRVLYRCESNQDAWIDPHDWSPDGKYILATLNRHNTDQQMVLISVADGSIRLLKKFSQSLSLAVAAISPDGRFVLYDYPQSDSDSAHDIFLLPVGGGSETPLIEYPADDLVLGWAPDGKQVLFTSDRRGSVDVWAVQTEDGKPKGTPGMLKSAVGGIIPLGITRSGSFYYYVGGSAQNVYVVKLDPKTGEVKEPPSKLVKRTEGFNSSPQYSPDGKYFAYISASRTRRAVGTVSGNTLCIQSLETGEEREYQREMTRLGVRWFSRPRWSPDGQSLLLYGRDFRDRYGIYLINIREDKAVNILRQQEEDVFIISAEGWRDAKNFFYAINDRKNDLVQIIQRDIDSGNEKIIRQFSFSKAPKGAFSVSRDGQWLSTLDRLKSGIMVFSVISAATGSVKQQTRFGQEEGPNQVRHTWSADGKYVYCTGRVNAGARHKFELWRIPVDGGPPQKTGSEIIRGRIDYMSAHPDGEHLAFQGGAPASESTSEVWVMENFLTQGR